MKIENLVQSGLMDLDIMARKALEFQISQGLGSADHVYISPSAHLSAEMFQLICKFFYMNHEWTIEEYDRRRDPAKQVRRYKLVKIGLIRDAEHCKR